MLQTCNMILEQLHIAVCMAKMHKQGYSIVTIWSVFQNLLTTEPGFAEIAYWCVAICVYVCVRYIYICVAVYMHAVHVCVYVCVGVYVLCVCVCVCVCVSVHVCV